MGYVFAIALVFCIVQKYMICDRCIESGLYMICKNADGYTMHPQNQLNKLNLLHHFLCVVSAFTVHTRVLLAASPYVTPKGHVYGPPKPTRECPHQYRRWVQLQADFESLFKPICSSILCLVAIRPFTFVGSVAYFVLLATFLH